MTIIVGMDAVRGSATSASVQVVTIMYGIVVDEMVVVDQDDAVN